MGLFEDRKASAKKVVELQNEVTNLKLQLKNASFSPELKNEIETLRTDKQDLEKKLQDAFSQIKELKDEIEKIQKATSSSDKFSKRKRKSTKTDSSEDDE